VIRATLTIAGKDLRQRVRDRSAIILAVLVPLGMAFIMSLTLGPVADSSFSTEVVVSDADGGPVATGFISMLSTVAGDGAITVDTAPSADEARAAVAGGSASTAYLIPDGFSEAATSPSPAALGVVIDPDQPIGALVGEALADGYVARVNAVRLAVATAIALGADGDPASMAGRAATIPDPVTLAGPETEGRGFDYSTFYAQGITVFFLFFTVQFGILSIIEEREEGTMPRLVVSPIPASSILLGKLLASFVMGVASAVVLWLATTVLMGARWGAPIGVIALILAGIAAAMGLTAAVAGFTRTTEQAGSITAFMVVVLGILGGTFFPVTRVSGAFTALSRLTPHFWLMEGLGRLSAGETLADVLPAIGAVLAFALVTGAVGLLHVRDLVRYR